MPKTILYLNGSLKYAGEPIEVTFYLEAETKIPEFKKEIHITVTDCPKEILDCYGEDYIEQMIREEVENER